jgi:5-methylcytosine-specific restriction endonuclease McrA
MMALLFLLVVLAVLAVVLFIRARRSRRQADESEERYSDLSRHVEEEKEQKRETARRRYVTKAMKQHVLERDNYTCQICGISKGYVDSLMPGLGDYLLLEVDHIVPVAKGGSGDDESNLQTLCWRCNRKKGKNRTNEEVREMIDYGIDKLN